MSFGFWDVGVKNDVTADSVHHTPISAISQGRSAKGGSGVRILVVPLWTLRFSGGGEIGASEARLEDMVMKRRRVRTRRIDVEINEDVADLIG